jgi:hypothetical protein
MVMNGLTGSIPSCFGNLSSLVLIDLSDNRLSKVNLEQLKRSWYVGLSNNNLDGQISPSIVNSSLLRYLYLDGNKFTGHVLDFQPTNGIYLAALGIRNKFTGHVLDFQAFFQHGWAISQISKQLICPEIIFMIRFQEISASLTTLNIWICLRTICLVLYHLASTNHQ